MNRILLTIFTLALVLSLSKFSYSQSTTTMQDIIETAANKVVDLEEKQNQEIVNVTFDLIVGTGKKMVYRNLDPAFAYNVSVIGDRRISKVRIIVKKKSGADWEYVDELSAAKPTMRVEPSAYEQYEFTVSVDEFNSGDNVGHFALLLYHKNPERGK